jgi:hypothetical protein
MLPKPKSDETRAALAPFLISESETKSWPGTTTNVKCVVRHYKLTGEVLPILCGVEGLYSWLHPKHPEDLAFYLSNGQNWLASVAHERMAWITAPNLTAEQLLKEVPSLQIQVRQPKAAKKDSGKRRR